MITLLSSTKAFTGRVAIQQIAAVRSWLALGTEIEVILYGDSPGMAAICRELKVRHVPNIQATDLGIPYFGAIAAHATRYARYDNQVYLNCDILLTPHILAAIERIKFPHFLMIGQRLDLAEGVEVDIINPKLINQLNALANADLISLHPPAGSDYFVFRRGMWSGLPPVIIGRGGYDNALIAFCLQRNIPIIDATLAILALHQYHDYSHTAGGVKEVFGGEDTKRNLSFVHLNAIPVLDDADFILRDGNIKHNLSRGDWLWHYFVHYYYQKLPILPPLLRFLWRIQLKLGIRHKWTPTLAEVLSKIPYE
jgi:hypothetical protein